VVLVAGLGQGDDELRRVGLRARVGLRRGRHQAVESRGAAPVVHAGDLRDVVAGRDRHVHRAAAVRVDAERGRLAPVALRVEAEVAARRVDLGHQVLVVGVGDRRAVRVPARRLVAVRVAPGGVAGRVGRGDADRRQAQHRDRGDRRHEQADPEPLRRQHEHERDHHRADLEPGADAVDQAHVLDHARVAAERQAGGAGPDPHAEGRRVQHRGDRRDRAAAPTEQEHECDRELQPPDDREADRIDPRSGPGVLGDHDQVDQAGAAAQPGEQDPEVGGAVAPPPVRGGGDRGGVDRGGAGLRLLGFHALPPWTAVG
jgi:hypothetical protein